MLQSTITSRPPISIDPEIMSGTAVFAGTRVPIQTLFDYLMDGCTLQEFLDNFPTVSKEAALKVLTYAAQKAANGKVAA
ncbi:MAG: DUF433 domain-containing protein [Caldilineaceae bacterium]